MQSTITGRIHIVGRGALATLWSVILAEAELPIYTYGRGSNSRIQLSLLDSVGERTCTVENFPFLDRLRPSSGDLVLVALKWPGLVRKLAWLGQLGRAGARILLPQNGIVGMSTPLSGLENIYPVVAHVSASMLGSDCVQVYSQGAFIVEDSLTSEYPWICRAWFHGIPADDFLLAQCIKLLIATTGARMALSGMCIGESLRSKEVRRHMAAIVREGATVLLKGKLAPHLPRAVPEMENLESSFKRGTFLDKSEQFMMDHATTSLHQDLVRRVGSTEAPWINGWVVHEGERLQIATPLNRFLLEAVERIAIERRTPDEARKDELLQARLSTVFGSVHCSPQTDPIVNNPTEADPR